MNRKLQYELAVYSHYLEMLTHYTRNWVYPVFAAHKVGIPWPSHIRFEDPTLSSITLSLYYSGINDRWLLRLVDGVVTIHVTGVNMGDVLTRLVDRIQDLTLRVN